jgi:putative transposase/transposase-like zinc-binding protein
MTRPRLEVADVLRSYTPAYLEAFGATLTADQRRVLRDLVRCRTAALGGHVEVCADCGHEQIAYNSCRNRHCPKCQAALRAQWLEERAAELLPVQYFHVVFTLPEPLGRLALSNRRWLYGTLFRVAAATLLQIAADPKHLGARIGFLAILHTWGQNLHLHPHLHCVVPGGGLAADGTRWIACRPGFFLPVRVLSRLFRGKFLARLDEAFAQGHLVFPGPHQELAQPAAFRAWLASLRAKEWVVYAKPPCGGPEQVLKYLARYTHRVAISNQRLVKMEDGKVHFHWKDYAHGNAAKVMALDAVEFIRRFLQHVLPSGFVRIRHFGFLANRCRTEQLERCRTLLSVPPPAAEPRHAVPGAEPANLREEGYVVRCPVCQHGRMRIVAALPPERPGPGTDDGVRKEPSCDTS